jgi:hypothetical protein
VYARLHVRWETDTDKPEHDAWVIGDEPVVTVDRFGVGNYAC